jgi:triphosphoribosyl-dephospho-CoA synthase
MTNSRPPITGLNDVSRLAAVRLSAGQAAMIACTLEATARKPGNVHRDAQFDDLCYADFLGGAAAIRPVLDHTRQIGVGAAILECVRETRKIVATNVNLGIALLLAPLAAVPPEQPLKAGVIEVLQRLTVDDASAVYEAIRLAAPGGLGRVSEQDVHSQPTDDLRSVMCLAADRDLVARQYANGFEQVFWGASLLLGSAPVQLDWEQAIVRCHLELMANFPDTLIARKCGRPEADEAARRAAAVLAAEWPATPESRQALASFDAWLRAGGHKRNPGTTADLVTASLFVSLRQDRMSGGAG